MKQITTTTGGKIRFLLRGNKPFMFDPVEAIVVGEEDAALLVERLGLQITVSDISDNDAYSMIENQANDEINPAAAAVDPNPAPADAAPAPAAPDAAADAPAAPAADAAPADAAPAVDPAAPAAPADAADAAPAADATPAA